MVQYVLFYEVKFLLKLFSQKLHFMLHFFLNGEVLHMKILSYIQCKSRIVIYHVIQLVYHPHCYENLLFIWQKETFSHMSHLKTFGMQASVLLSRMWALNV